MKPAVSAKSRLSAILNSSERVKLSIRMFERVLRAATASLLADVIVVGGDSAMRTKARSEGAIWKNDKGRGLNDEVFAQVEENAKAGSASMYIPGDLVLLTTKEVNKAIKGSNYGSVMTICPAFGDGGTNGLIIPSKSPMRLQLGPDSFAKHKALADSLDLPYEILKIHGFGLDLDIPDDLKKLQRKEPGCLNRLLYLGEDEPI